MKKILLKIFPILFFVFFGSASLRGMESNHPLDSALEAYKEAFEKIFTEPLKLEESGYLLEQMETLSTKIKREAKKLANQLYGQQIFMTLERRFKDAQTCKEEFEMVVRDIVAILRKDSRKRKRVQKALNVCFKLSVNTVLFPRGNKQFGEFLFVVCTQLLNDIKPGLLQFEEEVFGRGPVSKIQPRSYGVGFAVLGVISDAVFFHWNKCKLEKRRFSLSKGDSDNNSESILKILFTPVLYGKFCRQAGKPFFSRSVDSSPLSSPRLAGAVPPSIFA